MVNADAIPETLKERDSWVIWRNECRECSSVFTDGTEECPDCGGDVGKMPRSPDGGFRASTTDRDTWASFESAIEAHESDDIQTEGVGFVFDEEDTVAGFDLDDVRNPETGEVEKWARDVLEELDSYSEVSPSGSGYHVYVLGFHPGDKHKAPQESTLDAFDGSELELYDKSRFFTVTGDRVDEFPHSVEQRSSATQAVYEEYMADDDTGPDSREGATPSGSLDLSDQELLEKAKNAENGDKFERLWRGDTSGYPSHSEAQMAFASLLAFWTGGDENRMLELFEQSDMKRGEDDIRKFTSYDAPKAVDTTTEFYDPDIEKAATDGGATAANPSPPEQPDRDSSTTTVELSPSNVAVWAGLGEDEGVSDLDDRQKAATTWDLIRQHEDIHIRVRRDNGSLWAYDEGVWKAEGERALRHAARKALGSMNYGQNVLAELKAQARSDPAVEVEPDELGLEPGTIATENGLVYLDVAADGEGEEARRDLEPEDYALTQLPVEYDPEASYEEWQEYVEEWAEEGRADALQEYVGYCLHIGDMPIHRALLLVGSGANGKGTFLSVVRNLLGRDNTTSVELQTLANEKDAVADFYGALANIDDDLSARKLGAGLGMFKKLVGGDHVRARRLYEDGFEFKAVGKHLYAANEVPEVKVPDDDEAFWRRWLLVEFPNHYPPSDRDPSLRDRLTEPEKMSGVLNWAIDGWKRLLDQGHFTNEEQYAHDKRERWQAWGESVDKFISECVENDPDADRLTTGEAYRRYTAWCRENNHEPAGQQKLTSKLKGEGVGYGQSVRINGKVQRGYKALGLSDDVPHLEGDSDDTQQTGLS